MIHDDGSIDAWFAASGGQYGDWNYLFNQSGTHEAQGITGNNTVGQKFTAKTPFWSISVTSPNWNGKPCGFTFNLYKWDDASMSYSQVVQQTPVATATFKDYKDGEKIGVTNDDKFPAGTYLWELSKGADRAIGRLAGYRKRFGRYQLQKRAGRERPELAGAVQRGQNERL